MKFCERPWTFMYLIDAENGQVWPCSWLDSNMCMGNILNQTVEELIQSTKLAQLRESILDASFRFCDHQKCVYLANDSLPDLTEGEIKKITQTSIPHEFNIAYDETCNHACPSCRKRYFRGDKEYYEKVEAINEKMLPYYNQASLLSVNGRGEFFACEHLLSMLERLKPEREDFRWYIETNAALFDENHWKRISHLGKYPLNVLATVNSFHDSTYRYLNGYANHVDQVIKNLNFICSLRKKGIIKQLVLSIIVQESNFRELPEYVTRCLNEFGADRVRIRGIMQFSIPDTEYWIKDVFNPAHPFYREAIDILNHPVMKDPRVWYWEGDYEAVREPKELPIKRFEQYYNILYKMSELDDLGMLEKGFQQLKNKNIALYGAGHLAEYVIRKMQKFGMTLSRYIYDKNMDEKSINGVPVRRLHIDEKVDPNIEVVVNTLSFYNEDAVKLLSASGYHGEIILLEQIIGCCG